jgi:peptide/nickel transport system permease protein
MLAFVLRRLLQAIVVMLVVAFVAFLLFQYVGDPVTQMLGQDATPRGSRPPCALISASISRSSCSSPLSSAMRCRETSASVAAAGTQAVSTLIEERLPATLELSLVAGLIAIFVGIPMGVYTALRRDSWFSQFAARGIARRSFSYRRS